MIIPFSWSVDRIGCPSQGYFYFHDDEGKSWVLYLRWRSNPWTAELMPVISTESDEWEWDRMEVVPLSQIYEEEEDCIKVMGDSYEWLKRRFPEVKFPEKPHIEMYPTKLFTAEDIEELEKELQEMLKD